MIDPNQAVKDSLTTGALDHSGETNEMVAEQVHTPYCKQAPMCKTPCGNPDCVEQAEQDHFAAFGKPIAEQAERPPIGWTVASNLVDDGYGHSFTVVSSEPANTTSEPYVPLYAAPVRTKDLTDEELDALWHGNTEGGWRGLFRAVIAADREKNK